VISVAPEPATPATSTGADERFRIGSDPFAPSEPVAGRGALDGGRVVIDEEEPSPGVASTAEAQRRADTAACYEYARAQTRHDRLIIDDQGAAFDESTFEPTLARAQRQGEAYGLRKREKRLIQDCMEAKGYASP
jgi:hypothetical protein